MFRFARSCRTKGGVILGKKGGRVRSRGLRDILTMHSSRQPSSPLPNIFRCEDGKSALGLRRHLGKRGLSGESTSPPCRSWIRWILGAQAPAFLQYKKVHTK